MVVNLPRIGGRFASTGIVGAAPWLTSEFVESGVHNENYKILPFEIVDGKNEAGLIVNTNVVPMDFEPTTESVPTDDKEFTVCASMLPRFILDRFDNALTAVNYIKEHVAVYMPKMMQDMHYELHFMVADKNSTYCLEFVDNEAKIVDITDSPYIFNFYRYGVTLNDDNTVYSPATQDDEHNAIITNGITENGCGLERHNLVVGRYDSLTDNNMSDLLKDLYYTNSYYPENDMFTEFVGINGLNVVSDPADFTDTMLVAKDKFDNRSRDPESEYYGTWQTTHSVVYDMTSNVILLSTQEGNTYTEYELTVQSYGGVVRYDKEQELTSDQKIQARENIGAGTSDFDGSYNSLSDKPTIPAAQVNSDWDASSGVAAILNKPTNLSDFTNDEDFVDRAFVNSSIATNTANFIGTFESVEELEEYTGTVTNNDYAFVVVYDEVITTEVKQYDRYKYKADIAEWTFEYTLNNSSFTAEQWAAIQSGINSTKVAQIETNRQAIAQLVSALSGKQDTLTPGQNITIEDNVISASGSPNAVLYTAQSLTTAQEDQARENIDAQKKVTSGNKLSSDLIDDTNNTNKFVTAEDKESWDSKMGLVITGDTLTFTNIYQGAEEVEF